MAFRFGLRQRDRFAFLLQVGQRARFFQRPHFGGGAVERRFQRDLVGAFALHRQFQRFAFRFGQHLRRLARPVGMAFAFARHDGHARVSGRNADHFFLGRLHGGDAFDRLQARLLGLHLQFFGGARGLLGQFGLHRHLFAGAQPALLLGARAQFGGHADFIVGFDAGAQFRRFQFDRFQPCHAGLGGGAHGFQAFAVGGDRFFGRLRALLRGGGGGGIDGGAVFGQRAHARFGQRAALGGAGGFRFRFDAGNRFVDGFQFHLVAARFRSVGAGFSFRRRRDGDRLGLGHGRVGSGIQVLEIMQRDDAVLAELVVGMGVGLGLDVLCLHEYLA